IDERTYNIDPASIKRLLSNKTKAILPVHYAGQPVDRKAILHLAQEYGLVVIEDAAHAFGAAAMGQRIGGNSDHMTMFSFHPVKHITSGEGGAITTDNRAWYDR